MKRRGFLQRLAGAIAAANLAGLNRAFAKDYEKKGKEYTEQKAKNRPTTLTLTV